MSEKIIDNTPITDYTVDWGDPDGTGTREKSLASVQTFIKAKLQGNENDTSSATGRITALENRAVTFSGITGNPTDNAALNTALNSKFGKVSCTYVVDSASQLTTKTHGAGLTCLCKGDGKIYTSDGSAWNGGVLGTLGVIYIAESESYIFDTTRFVLLSTENADTLGGYQPSHYATASDLAAKEDKKQRVTEIPADGNYNPNVLYVLTLDSTARAINLNAAAQGLAAEYHLLLTIGATAPTITWPDGLKYDYGTGVTITAPTIEANHVYEINIVEGRACVKNWGTTV